MAIIPLKINKIIIIITKWKIRFLLSKALKFIFVFMVLLCLMSDKAAALSPDLASLLTTDEMRWLEENSDSIRYSPNPYWPPGDYMEKGIHKGIVSDYIRIFEEKLGIKFKKIYFKNWSDIIDGLKTGKTDFVGAARKTEKRKDYLGFTKPFIETHFVVILRNNYSEILTVKKINSMKLACPEGYSSSNYIRKVYPGAEILETKNDLDALLRVSAGAADGAVVGYMVSSYLIGKYGITNLKFGKELDFHWGLCFAVRKKMPVFTSVLDKALSTISDEERVKIYRKWVGFSLDRDTAFFEKYKALFLVGFTFIIFLMFTAFLFAVLMKKQVLERTKNLNEAKNEILESKEYLKSVLNSVGDAIFVHDAYTLELVDVNQRMCEMFGCTREEALKSTANDFSNGESPYSEKEAVKWLKRTRYEGPQTFEWLSRHKDGHCFWTEVSIRLAVIGEKERFVVLAHDLTERKKELEETDKLQSMFNQAQKMETVGQLAGGMAHDFNNMLSVIIGYSEIAQGKLAEKDPVQKDLKEIFDAANRAAEVIKQLLAFARKQTISPIVLDLNHSIEDILDLLRRLIGEDISINWQPCNERVNVYLDPSQLYQILTNLCVNARDAIDNVGEIIISTEIINFDEAYCSIHADFSPGNYVILEVSDNGCGINQESLAHIFEPFYTTKDVHKGTGLGLSMVYGIVKQNNGIINVYSESGKGTTFRICLPRIMREAKTENVYHAVDYKDYPHDKTVLIVDDESLILNLSRQILQKKGYNVLTESTPGSAVTLADNYGGSIDLLITDVVMPEMNGSQLAGKIQKLFPDLKVLYMSGYPAEVIAKHGVLDEGLHFIQKPFSIQSMEKKIREIFDNSALDG